MKNSSSAFALIILVTTSIHCGTDPRAEMQTLSDEAKALLEGDPTQQDYAEAAKRLQIVCNAEAPVDPFFASRACEKLEDLHSRGLGVEKDFQKIVALYDRICLTKWRGDKAQHHCKAAEQVREALALEGKCNAGDSQSCFDLGSKMSAGLSLPDFTVLKWPRGSALQLLEKACISAAPKGCLEAANAHLHDSGGIYDWDTASAKAADFFRQACEVGESEGCGPYRRSIESMSHSCEYQSNSKDCFKAGRLHLAAADKPNVGQPEDRERAKEFFRKACDGGVDEGCQALKTAFGGA